MPDSSDPIRRPETVAPRARRLLGSRAAGAEGGGREAGGGGEAMVARSGPPNTNDGSAIAARLIRAGTEQRRALTRDEASGIADRLVSQASAGLVALESGAPDWRLSDEQVIGLEAVLHVRGRPALRVYGNDLEDLASYAGAEIWQVAVDLHRETVLKACAATGAVRVRDRFAPDSPWVQGTAWLIAPDLVMTNRHVLFPPMNGVAIVRRVPGTGTAKTKQDYTITVDFAFDNGEPRDAVYSVVEVPFVAEERDPVDAAILKVERLSGASPRPLRLSPQSVFELERLFIIGHPGRLNSIPEEVRTVFGDPDERKRVSFGQKMEGDSSDPPEMVHDASTIGGYSGAPLLGFLEAEVRALHYWGDPKNGNKAISASALRRHTALGRFLASGDPQWR